MGLRTIPRTAVTSYLRVARAPFDAVTRAFRGSDSDGGRSAAELVVDRVDAAVRHTAGTILGDEELRADAERRRAAADERERALRLRVEAEQRSQAADNEFAERQERAQRQREEAARRAETELEQAKQQREQDKRRVATVEAKRKSATRETAQRREEQIESRERKARLEQLDRETEALAKKEKALTARDEAQRLRRAAAEIKSERKNGR